MGDGDWVRPIRERHSWPRNAGLHTGPYRRPASRLRDGRPRQHWAGLVVGGTADRNVGGTGLGNPWIKPQQPAAVPSKPQPTRRVLGDAPHLATGFVQEQRLARGQDGVLMDLAAPVEDEQPVIPVLGNRIGVGGLGRHPKAIRAIHVERRDPVPR